MNFGGAGALLQRQPQLQILDHKVAYFLISHVNNYFNSSACFINPRFAFAKSLRLFNIYEGGVRLVI